ncbi:C-C chemokine receptor type 8-like [Centroberyx affinis]|uniref:C-C chemokine receptor type 8-like n=1 Tax=Centroberyx affinis TaxID=166261 RepID=UPI003A5BDDC2
MNTTSDNGSNPCSFFAPSDDHTSQALSAAFAACSVNLVLSLPANSYVAWLIVTGAGGTMASEFFALNLAACDLLHCLSNFLFLSWLFTCDSQLYTGLTFFDGLHISPLFQSCICVERYLAVVHPVVFLKYKPLRYRVACCGVVWLLVLGSCVGFVFENAASLDMLLGCYVLLFLLMLFCCGSVLRALKRPGPGEGARERDREGGGVGDGMKRKAFRIISIVMMSALLNYLSFVVVLPLRGYFRKGKFYFVLSISASVSTMTRFVQPLLFLHRVGKLPCVKGL